jgi:hypothetical protein
LVSMSSFVISEVEASISISASERPSAMFWRARLN